jgi:receptor protein-tyrosine kinase
MIQVKSNFDVVIIDTPALCAGEDGAMMAVRTGAALAVARTGKTRMDDYNDMVHGLMNAGVAVVGSVLNDVPSRQAKKRKTLQ